MKALVLAAAAAMAMAGGASAQAPAVARSVAERMDIPGNQEAVLGGASFPSGSDTGLHVHHGLELLTVTEGSLEVAIQGRPTATMKPGDQMIIPRETPHSAKNVGAAPAKAVITWVVDKGKPMSDPVK